MWFNEFKKLYKWEPNDEPLVREAFEKMASRRFSNQLGDARKNLANGDAPPKWMSEALLAKYRCIWDKPEFKKKCEKNKKNRNSDCGGLGLSKHTGGSIPTPEHRRRMQEEKGDEPSCAEVYIKTHKKKSDKTFVCPKSHKVFETATHMQQTQPEVAETTIWLEAAGGVQKRGYVYGFGSDSQHYFSEYVRQKSKLGESSSQTSYEDRMRRMDEELKTVKEALARLGGQLDLIDSSDPTAHNPHSNQGSGVGLGDINTTNEETPSLSNVDVGDDATNENVEG